MKYGVIFAGHRVNERVLKISYALRKKGVSTAGVFQNSLEDEDYFKYFDFFREEKESSHVVGIVRRFPSDFVHLLSYSMEEVCVALFNDGTKKLVYDPKDVFAGILEKAGTHPSIVSTQMLFLQRSRGLVLRDRQAYLSARIKRYQLSRRRLFFPDWVWSTDLLEGFQKVIARPRVLEGKTSLRFAMIGNFSPERQFPGRRGAGQIHVFEALLSQGHRIDVFPAPYMANWDFTEYVDLAARFDNRLRISKPLPEFELIDKISAYDYGLFLNQKYYLDNLETYWDDRLMRYGFAARIFTYLSAALPFLYSPNLLFAKPAERLGYAIPIGKDDLSNIIMAINRFNSRNPTLNRNELSKRICIDYKVDRLISFYRSI